MYIFEKVDQFRIHFLGFFIIFDGWKIDFGLFLFNFATLIFNPPNPQREDQNLHNAKCLRIWKEEGGQGHGNDVGRKNANQLETGLSVKHEKPMWRCTKNQCRESPQHQFFYAASKFLYNRCEPILKTKTSFFVQIINFCQF